MLHVPQCLSALMAAHFRRRASPRPATAKTTLSLPLLPFLTSLHADAIFSTLTTALVRSRHLVLERSAAPPAYQVLLTRRRPLQREQASSSTRHGSRSSPTRTYGAENEGRVGLPSSSCTVHSRQRQSQSSSRADTELSDDQHLADGHPPDEGLIEGTSKSDASYHDEGTRRPLLTGSQPLSDCPLHSQVSFDSPDHPDVAYFSSVLITIWPTFWIPMTGPKALKASSLGFPASTRSMCRAARQRPRREHTMRWQDNLRNDGHVLDVFREMASSRRRNEESGSLLHLHVSLFERRVPRFELRLCCYKSHS